MSSTSNGQFVDTIAAAARPLYIALSLAEWEAATAGVPAAHERYRQAQTAWMAYWADPERHAAARRLHEAGDPDPLVARQLKLVYLTAAQNQQEPEIIAGLTALEAKVREAYVNFRAEVDGRRLSDNALGDILRQSRDSEEVQAAWEASKQVGAQAADHIRELARLRNAAARRQGFRDHFQRSLALNEIDEAGLLALFERLDASTREPFARLKAEIDRSRAARFGIPAAALRPWHYGDRFFQEPPGLDGVDLDALVAAKDPVALATATYDGLGLEVRDILARSDLYAREGKDQHAFCQHMDREGDVRTLNNLQPNHRWNETLLHELGHAVYEKYLDYDLPWLVRTPPHILSTEAVALLAGSLTYDREWLEQIVGVAAEAAGPVAETARRQEQSLRLVFTRWVLVMTHFEQALYADPERDLDTLWWDLVERYQGLIRPHGRKAPDWAAKYHVALFPVYYQNYELGFLVTAQLQHRLREEVGGIIGRAAAGRWLVDRFFRPGGVQDWAAHLQTATGEALNPDYFVRALG